VTQAITDISYKHLTVLHLLAESAHFLATSGF